MIITMKNKMDYLLKIIKIKEIAISHNDIILVELLQNHFDKLVIEFTKEL